MKMKLKQIQLIKPLKKKNQSMKNQRRNEKLLSTKILLKCELEKLYEIKDNN